MPLGSRYIDFFNCQSQLRKRKVPNSSMENAFTVLILNSATKEDVTYYLLQIEQEEFPEESYCVDKRFNDFVG